jgi:hypothetical protein
MTKAEWDTKLLQFGMGAQALLMEHFGPEAHVYLVALPSFSEGEDAPVGIAVTSFNVVLTLDTGQRTLGTPEASGGPAGGPYQAKLVQEHTLGDQR